jgi:hypothetical protein
MSFTSACLTSFIFLTAHALAGSATNHPHPHSGPDAPPAPFKFIRGDDWATGSDVSLGGIIFPQLHFSAGFGTSSGNPADLAVGHHDPNREGFTVQNIEFGASLRPSEYVEGFFTYAAVIDQDDQWAGSVEEAFGKLKNLPGGFEIRGGRYYNRFGLYNGVHPHAYPLVNRDLLTARMLGEDSVTTEGGELAWLLPGSAQWSGALSLSYGHAFLEEEEEEEEEEASLFSPEGAFFANDLFSVDARLIYRHNDFHHWTGLVSHMSGDNAYGRESRIWALGVEYLWRENGQEPGGRFFRWRTEAMHRSAGAVSAPETEAPLQRRTLTETGLSTSAFYGFNDKLQAGMGQAWVEGIPDAGLSEHYRISPLLQWNATKNLNFRLQYDRDHVSGSGHEDSVWMQFNYSWGGSEVR